MRPRLLGVLRVQFGVMPQVTTLAERAQVLIVVARQIVVEVRHGEYHHRPGFGMRLVIRRPAPLAAVPGAL
jgi:hypothetical protein